MDTITVKVSDDESWTLRIKRIHSVQRLGHVVNVSYGSGILHWSFSCPSESKMAADALKDAIDPPEVQRDPPEVHRDPHGVYVWGSDEPLQAEHWWFYDSTWSFITGMTGFVSHGQVFSLAPADQKPDPLTAEQIAALPRVTELPAS